MKKKGNMGGWIRKNAFGLILSGAAVFLCITMEFLYRIPAEVAVYTTVLWLFILGILAAFDYSRYKSRVLLLEEKKARILLEQVRFPETGERIEALYQEMLTLLFEERRRFLSEADKSRKEMVDYYTMWAHQIKTPIAAMGLLLQERGEEKGELSEELFRIEQYVEMVLSYLRLESMSSDLLLKRYELDGIVRKAIRKYARIFIRKKLTLSYEGLSCQVLTDEKWLSFVLEQLLSNALKYTERGQVSIFMEWPGVLVVADTGIGIRKEDLPRVFDRGFTGYNGREENRSTGIGLYLCKRIMGKLGHSLWLESEPGEGTKVYLDLRIQELLEE